LFYTYGGEGGTVASTMSTTAGSLRRNVRITAPPMPYTASWGWIAATDLGSAVWAAAMYTVALNVTQPNSHLKISGVKIYRVDAGGGGRTYRGRALVGSTTGLSVSLGSAGVKTFTVSGSAQQGIATDKMAVKFYTDNSSRSAQSFAFDAGNGALSTLTVGDQGATAISHITVVLMENVDYETLMSSSESIYIRSLAASNALLTNSHAIAHPSQPNYLALFSGSTQGVSSDYCPLTFPGPNLAEELIAKGYTFAGYSENLPSDGTDCQAGPTTLASGNLYQRKHNPWVDFTNVPAGDNRLYSGPPSSYDANVTFIVPNVCDDMHDCPVASGDAWLARNIPSILSYDSSHNGLLVLTWDEGDYSSTNHILTILAGPMVNRGSYNQYVSHYDVLRTIEANFNLPLLGASAAASGVPSTILH
ncbi:MAG: alkaline phosphatase family protein, partial [Candidatus Baltobacteraceae bacterium]